MNGVCTHTPRLRKTEFNAIGGCSVVSHPVARVPPAPASEGDSQIGHVSHSMLSTHAIALPASGRVKRDTNHVTPRRNAAYAARITYASIHCTNDALWPKIAKNQAMPTPS